MMTSATPVLRAIAFALVVPMTACGVASEVGGLAYPASPTVTDAFGLTERCTRGERGCEDRAWEVIRTALSTLEGPYAGPGYGMTDPNDLPQLYVRVSADPPLEARTEASTSLSTGEALFDLTGAVDGSRPSYVVISTGSGDERFVVNDQAAASLVSALYEPAN